MAVLIDWGTKIISVPKADLTFISGTLYEHNTDAFWEELKTLEASEEGMPFPDTQDHNLEYTVVGVTYAQKVEIINGYKIEYENGYYSVRLAGSNNNLFDVEGGILIQNNVQVIPCNSAGLIKENYTNFVTKLDELLGLSFKFSYRHSRVYDSLDRLISEKMDTYNSDANVQIHDGVTGIVAKYEITYTFIGNTDNVSTMLFTRTS